MDSNIEFCRAECEKNDYPFYLLTLFQPADKRASLWALGALRLQLENIAATVTQPTIGYMRLTFWRDEIKKIEKGEVRKGQPLLEALAQCFFKSSDLENYINSFEPLIEGQESNHAEAFSNLVQCVLDEKSFVRYHKQNEYLSKLTKRYANTKWQSHPPFLAFRLWLCNFLT